MASFITINGIEIPAPKRGVELVVSTMVDSGRNANAQVIGQKLGRDQNKINNLQWGYLSAEQWATILQCFSDFYAEVTFPDMVTNSFTTLKMYPGDRSAEPYWLDKTTKLPTHYINCKVNIVDTGY